MWGPHLKQEADVRGHERNGHDEDAGEERLKESFLVKTKRMDREPTMLS